MERLQAAVQSARFVKAFNQAGNPLMINPAFPAARPSMFICGNGSEAKEVVSSLLREVGWDVEDCGPVEAARAIEPLCMLWCARGSTSHWHHAFKLLR